MGSDIYCAICGGPVVTVTISTKTRPEDVKAAQRGGEPERDLEGYEPYDECAYDLRIITKEDAEWTNYVMVLGFNPNTKSMTK